MRILFFCLAAALALPANAQGINQETEPATRLTLGAGLAVVPRYPGSDRHKTRLVPALIVSSGRFFVGGEPGAGAPGAGLGVRLYRDGGWSLGAGISADFAEARRESDDPRLQGLGDVDGTVRGVLFAGYAAGWASLRASVATDIAGEHQGTLARLDAFGRYRASERLVLFAGPGLTWASGEYMKTFFGVDAGQSARSGLPRFEASSGLNSVRFSLGASYRIDPRWGLAARASLAKLVGDAADSPITATTAQNSFALFVTYRAQ